MTITIPGYSTLTGNPATILQLMQHARVFDELTGDEYIETVKENALRCFGEDLQVTGETYAQRAESLLHELAKHNLITIEN